MLRKLPFAIAVLVVAAALSGQPARADALADAVAVIPAGVEEVRFAGSWTEGDQGGTYRIIVLRSSAKPVTARLFVQWIALGGDGARVARSVEIAEFAALKADIADFFTEADADGLAVHIESAGSDGAGYELFITGPNDYRFGRASN